VSEHDSAAFLSIGALSRNRGQPASAPAITPAVDGVPVVSSASPSSATPMELSAGPPVDLLSGEPLGFGFLGLSRASCCSFLHESGFAFLVSHAPAVVATSAHKSGTTSSVSHAAAVVATSTHESGTTSSVS